MERREGGTFSDMVWRGERAGLSVTWFQRREGSGTQLQRLLDGGGGGGSSGMCLRREGGREFRYMK